MYNLSNVNQIGTVEFTEECKRQFNMFFSAQPEELVAKYCSSVSWKVLVVLFIAGCMWVCEPMFRKWLSKQDNLASFDFTIIFIYKWIGIGLLFIVGYALVML